MVARSSPEQGTGEATFHEATCFLVEEDGYCFGDAALP
jgi:hypothetical protein